jgi:hypothetical protein
MTQSEFNHFLVSIRGLSPDQLARLHRELESLMTVMDEPITPRTGHAGAIALPEAEFKRQLLKSGLMTSLPTPLDPPARRPFQPIRIEGEPLSETIIRERR